MRIEFPFNQLKENQSGGLLNELLELVENNMPFPRKITAIIRKQAALAIKGHILPLLSDWLNSEMEKVIREKHSSGLDFKTLTYIEII